MFQKDPFPILLKVRVTGFVVLWFFCSFLVSTTAKEILADFPYPVTVSMLQLFIKIGFCLLSMKFNKEEVSLWKITNEFYDVVLSNNILLLGFVRLLAKVILEISLLFVAASFANLASVTSPIFTILMSYPLLGELPSLPVIASVLPVVLGVGLCSATETTADPLGVATSFLATALFSLSNVLTKKILHKKKISNLYLALYSDIVSLLLMVPLWILIEGGKIGIDGKLQIPTIFRMVLNGVCTFIQTLFAFSIMVHVSALSYAVIGIFRKIGLVVGSVVYFGNEVGFWNRMGMVLAFLGISAYTLLVWRESHYAKGKKHGKETGNEKG